MYENLDLKRERQNCPFDKEEITNLIDGGADKTDERRQLGKKKVPLVLLTEQNMLQL